MSRTSRSRIATGLAPLAFGVTLFAYAESAQAYCRTTTCDPQDPTVTCEYDANGCLLTGVPLAWPDLCVTFAVEQNASPLRGISFEEASETVNRAFQAWVSADCGEGRHPSIGAVPLGVSYCNKVEYNFPQPDKPVVRAPNANIVMFRDDGWPNTGADATLALTTVTYNTVTGEILDADIEVNSFGVDLTTGDKNVTNDLQSILTHEVGHFFGIAHSRARGASMNPEYKVHLGDTSFRTLSPDDQEAICVVYPPQAEDVTDCTGEGPRFGFSRYCAVQAQANAALLCSVGLPGAHSTRAAGLGALGTFVALAGLLARRRRSTR